MKEKRKSESGNTTDDENLNTENVEDALKVAGIFLVRYSKKENSLVLTLLLDNNQLKNFIIRKFVSRDF